jgi:FAD/FMN-containing dehydrogenase
MRAMTREVIEAALDHEGRFYLPYHLHARREQLVLGYPHVEELFARKLEYDPGELFQNGFYEAYGR